MVKCDRRCRDYGKACSFRQGNSCTKTIILDMEGKALCLMCGQKVVNKSKEPNVIHHEHYCGLEGKL